jgi:hypothetical protein
MKRIGFVVVALLGCGCGGTTTGTLAGKVMFKGEPLQEGTVTVIASNQRSFQTGVQAGAYEIPGLPPGDAKVTVIAPDSGAEPGLLPAANDPTLSKRAQKRIAADKAKEAASGRKRQPVSPIYSKVETTPLKVTIKTGPNSYDIALK